MSQRSVSLENVDCIANDPVAVATLAAAPCPESIQTHLSPFSPPPPLPSVHPPIGIWSVTVSVYS